MSVSPSEMPTPALHPAGPVTPLTAESSPGLAPGGGVPAAVRAQLLSTEHWSLLATRSMTWSEIMSRITIHLTVSSASLVVLALFAQASGFGPAFLVMAIGLAAAVLVLGLLTGARVMNASGDDALLLVGMNRLRAAYVAIDPTIEQYLVTSTHDDQAGLMDTYLMGARRSTLSHVVASTALFVAAFNAIVAGTLGALVAFALGAGPWAVAVVGLACGAALFLGHLEHGRRAFGRRQLDVRFPSSG